MKFCILENGGDVLYLQKNVGERFLGEDFLMKQIIFIGILIAVASVACIPSTEEFSTTETAIEAAVLAEIANRASAATDTQTPASTSTTTPIPTITNTPTATGTPTPRPTNTPKPTPLPGEFSNPAKIGMTVSRYGSSVSLSKLEATLLEVLRGEEAENLARSHLFFFSKPFQGQEYLAVKARLDFIDVLEPENAESIYPTWTFTLRYSENGSDTYAENVADLWAEGYVPFSGEGWVFFLVKEGSEPYLYFHPLLTVVKQFGVTTGGAYFILESE